MSDLFATGIQIPNLDSGSARPSDTEGFIRVFSRNEKLYGVTANGTEFPLSGDAVVTVSSVTGADGLLADPTTGDVVVRNVDRGSVAVDSHVAETDPHTQYAPKNRILSEGVTTTSQVLVGDNSVEFSFNGEIRATYRIGGVDYLPNQNNPYAYRFRDADGSNFAGLRAPVSVTADYFTMLPAALGAAEQSLTIVAINGNQQQIGYSTPVKYAAGNPTIIPADFEGRRNQVILTGVPAHFKVLDDAGNVRSIFNQDQNNFLYWRASGTVSGTQAGIIYTQPTDPALTQAVSDGSIWIQI